MAHKKIIWLFIAVLSGKKNVKWMIKTVTWLQKKSGVLLLIMMIKNKTDYFIYPIQNCHSGILWFN